MSVGDFAGWSGVVALDLAMLCLVCIAVSVAVGEYRKRYGRTKSGVPGPPGLRGPAGPMGLMGMPGRDCQCRCGEAQKEVIE